MVFKLKVKMRYFFILAFLLVSGCNKEPDLQQEYWIPTDAQILKAKEIARRYAITELKVSDSQLSKMKTKYWPEEAEKIINIQFYDPEYFPDWENGVAAMGGFPSYFRVSVNVKTETVVDHYASEE